VVIVKKWQNSGLKYSISIGCRSFVIYAVIRLTHMTLLLKIFKDSHNKITRIHDFYH
jgi:hypothetical protein